MLQLHFTNTPGFKTTAEALRRTRSRGRVLGKFLPLTNRSRNPEATTCWAYSSANEGTRSTWHPSFRNTAIVLNKLTPISCRLNYPSSLHIHSIQHACSTILTAVLSSTKAPGKYWAQAWLSAISLTLKSFILTTPSPTLSSFGTYSNPIDPMNQWKMSYLMIWTSNFSASEVDKTFFFKLWNSTPRESCWTECPQALHSHSNPSHRRPFNLFNWIVTVPWSNCIAQIFCEFFPLTCANIEPSKTSKVKCAVPGSSLAESNK